MEVKENRSGRFVNFRSWVNSHNLRNLPSSLAKKTSCEFQPRTYWWNRDRLWQLFNNCNCHGRTKHINIQFHYTRNLVATGEFSLEAYDTSCRYFDEGTSARKTSSLQGSSWSLQFWIKRECWRQIQTCRILDF